MDENIDNDEYQEIRSVADLGAEGPDDDELYVFIAADKLPLLEGWIEKKGAGIGFFGTKAW